MVKWFYSVVFFTLICMPQWALAGVSASLNQYIVPFGESVQLSIQAKGSVDGEPDTSPLKQDFDILGQSQSSQFNMINGSISRSKTWEYSLMPKREGMIQVPAIDVGNEKTQALMLRVLNAQAQVGKPRDIWLEASLSDTQVYVQAQTILTVKLIRSVNLSQGDISAPDIAGAVVQRLGDEHSYEAVVDGRRVIITERKYAIFPKQSGQLQIPAVLFDGVISQSRSVFAQGKAIRLRSQPITLQVLPKPAAWDKHDIWLPAQAMEIEEQLPDGGLPEYRVGEPFTRNIVLKAYGLTSAQLPPLLADQDVDGFKLYPDQPELTQAVNPQGLVGIRREKVAMIPTKAGKLYLPEIRVKWWDTKRKQVRSAVIAAREIEVLPAKQNGVATTPAQPSATQQMSNQAPESDVHHEKNNHVQPIHASHSESKAEQSLFWKWSALLFAALWLITLLLWWRISQKATKPKHTDTDTNQQTANKDVLDKALIQACKKNHAKKALELLPQWGAAYFADDSIQYVSQLKGRSKALDQAISDLEASIYAAKSDAQVWQGEALIQAIREIKAKQGEEKIKQKKALKTLYS